MKSFFSIIFITFFLGVQNSFAAPPKWDLDINHSNFYFSVDHIFSKTRGHFTKFEGSVSFDPQDLSGSNIDFKIKVSSIYTGNAKRDKHLQSGDFFEESKYPYILFKSSSIKQDGPDNYLVHGKMTIKGKEYDLNLPLSLAGVKDHPTQKGSVVAGFNGNLTIDRLAYGVGNGKFVKYGVIGKDVDILISLELLRKK